MPRPRKQDMDSRLERSRPKVAAGFERDLNAPIKKVAPDKRNREMERLIGIKDRYPNHTENPDKTMTEQQKRFVFLIAHQGLSPSQAAFQAEYKHPRRLGDEMMKRVNVQKAIEIERAKYAAASMMTRKKVIDGFVEAVDLARITGDSIAMTAAWREIGKMCGFYEPQKHEITVSMTGQVLVTKIQQMTDAELLRLAEEQIADSHALSHDVVSTQ